MRKHSCAAIVLVTITLWQLLSATAFAVGGDIKFSSREQRPRKQTPVASVTDSAGNTYITGNELPAGAGIQYQQIYTIKIASNGSLAWRAVYQRANKDVTAAALVLDSNGDLFVAGNSAGDVLTIKYPATPTHKTGSSDPNEVQETWVQTFDNGGTHIASASSMVIYSANVYVAGSARYNSSNSYMVLAYDKGTGTPATWQIPSAGTNITGSANSVAVNSSGIAITGTSSDSNMQTVRYHLDGTYWWDVKYANATHYSDAGVFVKIDSSGNVVATGRTSFDGSSHYNIYTAKYNGSSGAVIWSQSTNPGNSSEPDALFVDQDTDPANQDHVYVTGHTSVNGYKHIYTVRYKSASATPQTVWAGGGVIYNSGGSNIDFPTSLVVDPAKANDSLFVAGYTSSSNIASFRTIKFRKSTGDLLWTQAFHDGPAGNNNQAMGISLDADGNPYVVGYADETTPLHTYSATADNGSKSVLEDITNGNWASYWVMMTNGANSGQFQQIASNDASTLTLITPLPFAITSGDNHYIYDKEDQDYFVVKYDRGALNAPSKLSASAASNNSINLTWQDNNTVSVPDPTKFRLERCTASAAYLTDCPSFSLVVDNLTGASYTDSTGLQADTYYYYRVIAHNTAVGDTASSNVAHAVTQYVPTVVPATDHKYTYAGKVPSNGSSNTLSIAASPVDGNPVVTGNKSFTPGGFDYYTIKLDRTNLNNGPTWSQRYGEPQIFSGTDDVDTCLAIDNTGQVIVSGFSYLSNHGTDMDAVYTIKYQGNGTSTPNPLWTHQYNATGGGNAQAVAIATDSANNIALVGMGLDTPTNFSKHDIYVLRYPQTVNVDANQNILTSSPGYWAATPISSWDDNRPTAVAFDPSGNVIITGFVKNTAGGRNDYDIYTAKFDGTNGNKLWERIFDGKIDGSNGDTINRDDEANDVAVDKQGNVYVTGFTTNAQGNRNFITISYDASGNKSWAAVTGNPMGGDDNAMAVKIDPVNGDVVVAGTRLTDPGNHDFHIIRYNAGDGSEIRHKTFLKEGSDENLVKMAMDGSGSVFVTGSSTDTTTGAISILTVEVDWQGNIVGNATTYSSTATPSEAKPFSIAANYQGEVFVAGYAVNADSSVSNTIFKIDGDTFQSPNPVTASPGYTTVTLHWPDASRSEDGYQVARNQGTCPATWADNQIIASSLAADTVSYPDSGLTQTTAYCYGVRSYKGTSYSRWASTMVTTTTPPAPAPVSATAIDTTTITVAWTATTSGHTGFDIWRCADSSASACTNFSPLTSVTGTYASYNDQTVCPGTIYRYQVRATGPGWSSSFSTTAGAVPPSVDNFAFDSGLEAPNPMLAGQGIGWTYVGGTIATDISFDTIEKHGGAQSLNINAVATPTTPGIKQYARFAPSGKYQISAWFKSSAAAGKVTCDLLDAASGSFTNSGTTSNWEQRSLAITASATATTDFPGGSRIRCYVAAGSQANIDDLQATPQYNLTAARANEMQINLSWVDSAFDETGYKIERCSGGSCGYSNGIWSGTWNQIIIVPANSTSYSDIGLTPDTSYSYRIRPYKTAPLSCNGGWDGGYSNMAGATTTNNPPVLTTSAPNTTTANLGWTDTTANETQFQLERCTGGTCTMPPLDSGFPRAVGPSAINYSDSTACNNTAYNYRIQAVDHGLSIPGANKWTRRVPINITNSLANYQTKLNVAYRTGMNLDYSDIRIFDATANLEIPYWIDTPGPLSGLPSINIWFKTINQNDTLYLYYNNATATAPNYSGSAVFDFFDDFTGATLGAQWGTDIHGAATVTVGGGTVTLDAGVNSNHTDYLTISKAMTPPYNAEVRINNTSAYLGQWLIRNRMLQSGVTVDTGIFDVTGTKLQAYYNNAAYGQVPTDQYVRVRATHTGGSTNVWSVYKEDGTQIYSTSYTGTPTSIHFSEGDGGGGNGKAIIDWVFARKYAAVEPNAALGTPVPQDSNDAGFDFSLSWDGPYSNTTPIITPKPVNLVADPDFENGATSWATAAGTTTGTSFDTTVALSGMQSFKLSPTGAKLGRSQTISNLVAGQQYTLSAFIKASGLYKTTSGDHQGKVQCTATGTGITTGTITVTDTANWTATPLTATVTSTTGTSATISCYIDTDTKGGQAWIDMVQLVPVMPVTSLTATHKSEQQIDLTWNYPANLDQTGFKIDRCGNSDCSTVLTTLTKLNSDVATGTSGSCKFSDTGLAYNSTYWYRVRGYKTEDGSCNSGKGFWETVSSAIQSANTNLTAPAIDTNTSKTFTAATTGCEDIRVIDPSEGVPSLSYFIANKDEASAVCNKTTTKLTANIPNFPAGSKTIYLYYGNLLSNDLSNAGNTFSFFEDFDYTDINSIYSLNKWDNAKSDLTGFSVSGSKLHGTISYGYLTSKTTYGAGYQVQARVKSSSNPFNGFEVIGFANSSGDSAGLLSSSGYGAMYNNNSNYVQISASTPAGTGLTDTMIYSVGQKTGAFNPLMTDIEGTNNVVYWSPGDIGQTVNARPIKLGQRFDSNYNSSGYTADWEWIRVRKYATPAPTYVLGQEETQAGGYSLTGEPGTWGVWRFRKPVTITNSTGSTLNSYQLDIVNDTTTLAVDRNTLTWTDSTSNETGFRIERCLGTAATCVTGATPAADATSFPIEKTITVPAQSGFGSQVSYNDREVAVNTNYCYRVKAYNAAWTNAVWTDATPTPGQTVPGNVVCMTTINPGAPSSFTANPQTSVIDLSWTDNSIGENGFTIERCKGATCTFQPGVDSYLSFVRPPNDNAISTTVSFTDTSANGLDCTGTYLYRITAFKNNPDGTTWTGGPVNATAAATLTTTPATPTGVTVTRTSEQQIAVGWSDTYTGETGYEIYRCTGAGCIPCPGDVCPAYALLTSPAANAIGYNDINFISPGTTYGYQVRVKVPTTCDPYIAYSAPSAVKYAAATVTAPSGLISSSPNTTQASLSWTDNTVAESGFDIMRCSGPPPCTSSFIDVGSANPGSGGAVNFGDTSACANTVYTYIVAPKEHVSMPLSNPGSQPVWRSRAPLNFSGFQANTATQITIPYDSDMKSDFSDIRFYDRDAKQELPYWFKSVANSSSAVVWLKTGATSNIDLYYGNPNATSSSSTAAAMFAGSGLAGYWPFEEANNTYTGNTADISGNGLTGSLTTWSPCGVYTSAGKIGNGLKLDCGGTYRVTVADTTGSVLDLTGSMTVELWYNFTATNSAGARLLSKGDYPAEPYSIQFDGTGKALIFYVNSGLVAGTYYGSPASPALTTGWHHIVGMYDYPNKKISIFIDGIEYSTTLGSAITMGTNNSSFTIGGMSGGGSAVKGMIDEVRLYNRILSYQEIANHYTGNVTIGPKSSTWYPTKVPLNFSGFQPNTLAKITIARDPVGSETYNPRPDFRDLRFFDRDANKDLPYWIRKINRDGSNNPISAEAWFMPGATSGIDLYYGNPGTSYASPDTVGWWPFEESANTTIGKTADWSGWGLDGTLSYNFSAPFGIVAGGKYGSGLSLDGTSQYVTIQDNINTPVINSNSLTIEAWAKYNGVTPSTTGMRIVNKYKSGTQNNMFSLYTNSSGKLQFVVGDGYNNSAPHIVATGAAPQITDNNWHHYVGRYDASTGTVAVIIDGVHNSAYDVSAAPITIPADPDPLTIGATNYVDATYGRRYFNGMIDDVRIYNRALSDPEIQVRAAEGASLQVATIASNGPVAYWPFEEGAGQTTGYTADQSGNNPPRDALLSSNFTGGYGIIAGGKFGNALKLNGSSNYLSIPAPAGSKINVSGSITVEAWYKYDNTNSGYGRIIDKPTSGATGNLYSMGVDNASPGQATVNFMVKDGVNTANNCTVTSPASITTNGTWYHLAGSYDTTTHRLSVFVNGSETYNTTCTLNSIGVSTDDLIIGQRQSAQYLKGMLDEVAIYSRALDPSEITTHYNAGTPLDMKAARTSTQTMVTTPVPGNMIQNPDFESGTGWWNAWPNWSYISTDSTVYNSGKTSLKISENQGASAYRTIYQSLTNLMPGGSYVMSGYMNLNLSAAGHSYAICQLTSWGVGWGSPSKTVYGTDATQNNKGWIPFSVPFTLPAKGANAGGDVVLGNLECAIGTDSGGGGNNTAWFDMVQITPVAPLLSATRASESSIDLSWADNFGSDKTGFNVYRCMDSTGNTPCTDFVNIKKAVTADIPYRDTGLLPSQTYRYKVTAYKSATCPWESAASNIVSVQTTLYAPALQSVTPLTATSMQLTWSDTTSSDTAYNIYRCIGNGCEPCTNPADCSTATPTYTVQATYLSRSLDQWRKAFYPLTYSITDKSNNQATGTTNVSNQITNLIGTTGLSVGMAVTGTNIQPNTVISDIFSDPASWLKYDSATPNKTDSLKSNPNSNSTLINDGRIGLAYSAGQGDTGSVQSEGIIIDDGPLYKMWYSGNDNGTSGSWRIFYATSPDGLNWTKYDNSVPAVADSGSTPANGNGRIPLGSSNKNINANTTIGDGLSTYASPSVIKDGSVYKMWYSASDGQYWRIYYATSLDGLNWTKYDNSIPPAAALGNDLKEPWDSTNGTPTNGNGRLPLGSSGTNIGDKAGVFAPSVIKDGSVYKMWYSGTPDGTTWRVFYATSTDGLNWTKYDNTIPPATATGANLKEPWDSSSGTPTNGNGRLPLGSLNGNKGDSIEARFPSVMKDGQIYRMWYSGVDDNSNTALRKRRILYATSTDGLNWTKYNNGLPADSDTNGTNGAIPVGTATGGKGDISGVFGPSVIKDGPNYRMWYTGQDGSNVRRIFMANNLSTVTLSKNPAAAGAGNFVFGPTGNSQTGSVDPSSPTMAYQLTGLASTAALSTGMSVTGPNIPAGTTISAITSPTSVTLSNYPTAAGSGNYVFGLDFAFTNNYTPNYDAEGGLALQDYSYSYSTPSTSILDNDNHTIEFDAKFASGYTNTRNILTYSPSGGPALVISSKLSNTAPYTPNLTWTYNGSPNGVVNLGTDGIGAPLVANKWYHIRGVKIGSILNIYVNDKLAATATVPVIDHTAGTRSAPLQLEAGNSSYTEYVSIKNLGISSGYSGAVDSALLTYTDTQACPGTYYNYRVMPVNNAVPWNGATSNRAGNSSLTFYPPTGLTATAISENDVLLSWLPSSQNDQNSFIVQRCQGASCTSQNNIYATTYDWSGLTGDATQYCFSVAGWKNAAWCPGGGAASLYIPRMVDNVIIGANSGTWSNRAQVNITNPQPGFQTRLVVGYLAGMNNDFSDIRLFDMSTQQEIPYWLENKTDGNSATIWFKTPNSTSYSIYLYYGNSAASAPNYDGSSVFEFFDDFNSLDASVPTTNGNDPAAHKWSTSVKSFFITKAIVASGSTTSLTDDGNSTNWNATAGYYTGKYLLITSVADPLRSQNTGQFRKIGTYSTSGNIHTINTDPAYPFPVAIGAGDSYDIIDDPTNPANGPYLLTGTAASGSGSTLVDSVPASWVANQFQNFYLKILSVADTTNHGANVGQYRQITANTASPDNTITVNPATPFPAPIGAGDTYQIISSPTEPAHTLRIANGSIYSNTPVLMSSPFGYTFEMKGRWGSIGTTGATIGLAVSNAPYYNGGNGSTNGELYFARSEDRLSPSGFQAVGGNGAAIGNNITGGLYNAAPGMPANSLANITFADHVVGIEYRDWNNIYFYSKDPVNYSLQYDLATSNANGVWNPIYPYASATWPYIYISGSGMRASTGSNFPAFIDWVRVRKYSATPTVATLGAGGPRSDINTVCVKTMLNHPTNAVVNNGGLWADRTPVNITNCQTGIQTRLVAGYLPGMKSDFSDIRLYDTSTGLEIPFWQESMTPGGSGNAMIWFKPTTCNTPTSIYLYYGNSTAVAPNYSASSIFDFFEGFDTLDVSSPTVNGNDPVSHRWSKSVNNMAIIKGTAGATGNTATTLQDDLSSSGGSWATANYYLNYYLLIMSVADPSRSANAGQFRKITANTTGRLITVGSPFPVAIGQGDTYQIIYDPTNAANLTNAAVTGGTLSLSTGAIFTNAPVINSSPVGYVFEMKNNWTGSGSLNRTALSVTNSQFATNSNGNANNEMYFAHMDLGMTGSGLQLVAANGAAKNWNLGAPYLTNSSGIPANTLANVVNSYHITGIAFQGTNDLYYYALDPATYATQYYSAINSPSGVWTPVYPYATATAPYLFLGHAWGENAGGAATTIYPFNIDWVRVRKYAATTPVASIGAGGARPTDGTDIVAGLSNFDGSGGNFSPYPYKIPLIWKDNSGNERAYIIERKIWNGQWMQLDVTSDNTPSYIDTVGIEPQKTYTYRIKALKSDENVLSPASNVIVVTTPAFNAPTAPDHTTCVCTQSGTVCQ